MSGDNEKEASRFLKFFGERCKSALQSKPVWTSLSFIRELQDAGKTVMMVGDGLNDAGALKQSDVGVAVVEKIGVFSPASDVILDASQLPRLCVSAGLLRGEPRIVRAEFRDFRCLQRGGHQSSRRRGSCRRYLRDFDAAEFGFGGAFCVRRDRLGGQPGCGLGN